MNKFYKAIIIGTLTIMSGYALQANAQPFYFDQRAGFDPSSFVKYNPALTESFSGALGAGYPGGVVSDLSWEFGANDPGDPSALNITTYSDAGQGNATGGVSPSSGSLGDTNGNGLWDMGESWTVTRLTQTNNVINGPGVPLWDLTALANLEIFADAGHNIPVFSQFNHPTSLTFNETLNTAPCDPNQTGTICEDYYLSLLNAFLPVTFNHLGIDYDVSFGLIPADGTTIIDMVGNHVRIITPENSPGISMIDVNMQYSRRGRVPEPTSIALIGLGLVGIGFANRRKLNHKKM